MDDHWLTRASTIKRLWIVFAVILAMTVLADVLVEHHPYFGPDGSFGFSAWFGFVSCVVLVVFAKGLGVVFKRPDTYYDR